MCNRKHSSRESEPQIWYFIPVQHEDLVNSVVSFRRWNIVIIAILGMMVLGLMLFAIVPPPSAHSPTAAHAPLRPPASAAPAKHRISKVRTHQDADSVTA
jgi:hypothetical protein